LPTSAPLIGTRTRREYVAQIRDEILLLVALGRTMMAPATEIHDVPYERISRKGALLTTAARLTLLLLHRHLLRSRELLDEFLSRVARCVDHTRRRRVFPRRSFKPMPRWGPKDNINDRERSAS
jgi:hypothetical protein